MRAHVRSSADLPVELYTAAQTRALDRVAIEARGIPGYTLMCRAAAAAFESLRERWPGARRIAVVCGGGNNGGDGYVLTRLAREAGLEVQALYLKDPGGLKGDALAACEDARRSGVPIQAFEAARLNGTEVIVDACFGTGLEREVAGAFCAAIEAMNACPAGRLAIDIPSGLHADRGAVLGTAVEADVTVSFIALKQGLFTGEGPACCGRVVFADLAVPADLYAGTKPASRRYAGQDLPRLLPRRSRSAHKGDCGHVLVVGGELGMAGAARMAAEAAARCGAGLVSVATRAAHAGLQAAVRPEAMFHGVETPEGLAPLLARASVVAVGPGLGRAEWGQGMLAAVLASDRPLVVDADGLNQLAERPVRRGGWVLTPHPGEAARLLGTSSAEVQADRFAAVRELVHRYGGVCALKGAGSLVADEDGLVTVNGSGNPGMASGGMGDVLTGVIAGLLAQGLSAPQAGRAAVHIHGRAADLAAEGGERGLLATDLMPFLRALVNPPPS